jgi:protein-lysine N-methyltransferase EEF2KMT
MESTKCITVVHCWSAPRSRSTALCYSFEARANTVALDEPLYVDWLRAQGEAVSRPYLPNLLQGIPVVSASVQIGSNVAGDDWRWKRELLSLEERIQQAASSLSHGGVIFCKQMAKFCDVYNFSKERSATQSESSEPLKGIELKHKHVLLIRDPVSVLSSWGAAGDVHGNNPTIHEVGIVPLLSIFSALQSRDSTASPNVIVLDSDELVDDPRGVLQHICRQLEVDYQDSM